MNLDRIKSRRLEKWDREVQCDFQLLSKIPSGGYVLFFDYLKLLPADRRVTFLSEIRRVIQTTSWPIVRGIELDYYQQYVACHRDSWRYLPLGMKKLIGMRIERRLRKLGKEAETQVEAEGFTSERWEAIQSVVPATTRMLRNSICLALERNFRLLSDLRSENLIYESTADTSVRLEAFLSGSTVLFSLYMRTHGANPVQIFPFFEDVICHGQAVWGDITQSGISEFTANLSNCGDYIAEFFLNE
jgi:hypothetical protein